MWLANYSDTAGGGQCYPQPLSNRPAPGRNPAAAWKGLPHIVTILREPQCTRLQKLVLHSLTVVARKGITDRSSQLLTARLNPRRRPPPPALHWPHENTPYHRVTDVHRVGHHAAAFLRRRSQRQRPADDSDPRARFIRENLGQHRGSLQGQIRMPRAYTRGLRRPAAHSVRFVPPNRPRRH